MANRFAGPPFQHGLENRDNAWDFVVKVKYNSAIKRFLVHVNGSYLDHNLDDLLSKIASAFKFSSDAEFNLTYTDVDGDVIMLDDESDLRDAAINQKLNPLRINVQLKNSNAEAPRTKQQASNSRSPRSSSLEDQLAQVKSTIDEAMKLVPEQVPAALAKLSHELRSRAASSVPSLAELLDRLATLMTPKGNIQTSIGPVYGSSCSSSGGSQALRNAKTEHENKLMTGSASQSADMQNAPGLKSVPPVDPKSQVEKAPVHHYHSVDSQKLTSSAGKKSERNGSTVAGSKIRCVSQSKGKSTSTSTLSPGSSSSYGTTHSQLTPAPPVSESKLRYWPTYGHNRLVNGGLQSRSGPPAFPPYNYNLGFGGNINKIWQPPYFPPTDMCASPKLDMPSSVGAYVPSKDGLYPFGSSYKYSVPSSVSYNTEGRYPLGRSNNYGSIPQPVLHKWIQCDGCGETPIVGTRYKSNIKDDYDLCGACFSKLGSESEYTRLDKPDSNRCLQQGELKLDCNFINDVTVPDGTSMTPLNAFTKIWRLQNSGSTVWPFGTQVVWVDGDQFAVQDWAKLKISLNGVAAGQEVDVSVDFLAPANPGRYISYWQLALPSGKLFGQRIWVCIQVKEPIQTSGNKQPACINLNLPPAANSAALKPLVDTNSTPRDPCYQYPLNIYNEMPPHYHDSIIQLQSESESASSTFPSVPAAGKQVQAPSTDHHASSSAPAFTSVAAAVPAPETIPLPKSVSFAAPISASSVLAPTSFPVQTSSVPTEVLPELVEKLLRELDELGFRQADLNKEILRQNKYDLEQSIRDLCGLAEWDPLLGELSELL